MKNVIIIIFLLSYLLTSCDVFQKRKNYNRYLKIPSKEEFDTIPIDIFQVTKMDTSTYKYNNVFYMKKDNYIYKVISKKEMIKHCEKIIVGNFYKLKIPIEEKPNIIRSGLITSSTMYELEPVMLELSDSVKWELFITPYIRGTCYITD